VIEGTLSIRETVEKETGAIRLEMRGTVFSRIEIGLGDLHFRDRESHFKVIFDSN
jgi:hypothetical protein